MHLCSSVNRKQLTLLRKCFTKRPSISLLLYPTAHRHQLKFLCTACLSYHELPAILHENSLISLISHWNIFWPAHHSTGALEFQNHSAGYLYRLGRTDVRSPDLSAHPNGLHDWSMPQISRPQTWSTYPLCWLRKTVRFITDILIKTGELRVLTPIYIGVLQVIEISGNSFYLNSNV